MKAIENVREKANQVINRYGKVIFTFLIFFTLLGTAQVAEAQSGLKINSLSEVTDKAKEGADTILDVAKYILAAVLGIALVFVIYSLATNNPHAKEYLGIPARLDHRRGSHHGGLPDYLKTKSHENHA